MLLAAGTRLGPAQIGAARGGRARRGAGPAPAPGRGASSTGNELVEPGTPLARPDLGLQQLHAGRGGPRGRRVAYRQPSCRDDPDAVLDALEDQLIRADLLVTTGGVSMGGEHDVVKAALRGSARSRSARSPCSPGCRRASALLGPDRTPIFTLPGNPVSAYVSFQLFVRPALRCPAGPDAGARLPPARAAVLTGPVRSPAGRRSFLRGVLDREAGHGHPADRAGLAPARRAGPGQRADRRAGAGRPDERGRAPSRCWSLP